MLPFDGEPVRPKRPDGLPPRLLAPRGPFLLARVGGYFSYPPPEVVFPQTFSHKYALSTLTQEGLEVVPNSVQLKSIHMGFRLNQFQPTDAGKEAELMRKCGLRPDSHVVAGFDVYVKVRRIHP